jgi:hypothetical protein
MTRCHYCKKVIRGTPFELYNQPYHLSCLAKQIRIERRNAKQRKAEREQTKIDGVWRINA